MPHDTGGMGVFSPATLRGRVYLMIAALLAISALASGLLLFQLSQSRDTIDALHNSRVVPLVELKGVSDAYAITIVDTAHKVADGQLAAIDGLGVVVDSRKKAQAAWQAYLNTPLPTEERALAGRIQPVMARADAAIADLEQLLASGDIQGVRTFREQRLYPAFDPLTALLDDLGHSQQLATLTVVERSNAQLRNAMFSSVALLLFALLMGLVLGQRIGSSILKGVNRAVEVAEAVAAGNLKPPAESPEETRELARLQGSLRAMGRQLGDAMEQVQDLARRDPLTQLLNRRALEEVLGLAIGRNKRGGSPCALLFIDLDHFKIINDQFGHAVGDEALKVASQRMRAALREIDTLARYGGEEFVAVLPGASREDALNVAERLRRAVGEPPPASLPRDLRLATSVGVALLMPDDTQDAVLGRADNALYAAKTQGRNRVVLQEA